MAVIKVEPATDEYGRAVAADMRPADQKECWALAHHTPMDAVERSLAAHGIAYAFLVDDMPLAIFGCAETTLAEVGSPWLLGAVGVEKYARQFLALGRDYVGTWAMMYDDLYNVVHAENTRSIQWLRKLGFVVSDQPLLLGPDIQPFLPFHLRGFHV